MQTLLPTPLPLVPGEEQAGHEVLFYLSKAISGQILIHGVVQSEMGSEALFLAELESLHISHVKLLTPRTLAWTLKR